MSPTRLRISLLAWAIAGFAIGVALGVTTLSVWLVAIGFGVYLAYLRWLGPANNATEGWLFASGPVFMMAWVAGFIVQGVAS